MTFKVIDVHVHLGWISNVERALEVAKAAGVGAIIAMGVDLPANDHALEISRRHKGFVFPFLGIHPWWNTEEDIEPTIKHMEDNIAECVGIGEIGLDYNYFNYFFYPQGFEPKWGMCKIRRHSKEVQTKVFESALKLAAKYDKPVMLHTLTADEDAFRMVKDFKIKKAVFHNFMTPELVKEVVDEGYFLSAGPRLNDEVELHTEVIKRCPIDRMLLETDAPVGFLREPTSEPADVLRVLKVVADLKGMGVYQVADQTTRNAISLFNLGIQL